MHRLWGIPELLPYVFIHLENGDLVHISRTCRNFWYPASVLIWQTLPDPTSLLGFFVNPEFVQRGRDIVTFHYTHFEWERFRLHAPFVRSLRFSTNRSQKEYCIISVLIPVSKGLLLPNLRELDMEIPAVFPSPEALDSLLSPSLQQLYVRLPANRQRNDRSVLSDAFVKDVVQTIRAKLPKLDDFSLYFGHPTTSDTISTIVDSLSGRPFRRLSFKCWGSAFGPSPDVTSLVRFLSQVENLRDVTFTFNDKDMLPALPDEGGFATLETLELHGHATSMLQFVSLVQSSQLKRLGMDSAVTPVRKIGDQSVLKHCEQFKLLTSFEMNFELVPTLMKFDDIRPLLKCSHLEIVVMYLPKFFGLNRHQLEAMLSSWPRLTRLALGEWDDGKEGRAKLTVLDLLLLSKYCPILEELEICVNTDSLEAGLPHTLPPDWILPRLVTLDFRQSRVGEYGKDLARLVAHLWPNLKEVHVEWWPPESANWSRVWEEVEAITGNDLDESNRDFM